MRSGRLAQSASTEVSSNNSSYRRVCIIKRQYKQCELGTKDCRLDTTHYGGRTPLDAASAAWRGKSAKVQRAPDDMSVELVHMTWGLLTTLDVENTFNMDRGQMRHTKGGQLGRLPIWHRTIHGALLREADKEMLEELPADITESPRSVPLGAFDSRKCEFSFGEKFFDTSMEDSPALLVYTPMNFWRCANKNGALVQCNEYVSCFESFWHCMVVCEGSVVKACDNDQLWYVLEVTPAWCFRVGWHTVHKFHFSNNSSVAVVDSSVGPTCFALICI